MKNLSIINNFQRQMNIDSSINLSCSMLFESLCKDSHNKLKQEGFLIIKDAVSTSLLIEIRNFWLNLKRKKVLHSNLLYGEENYSKNFFGKYIRHFDFYWNEPTHKITRDLSLTLHMYRNILIGEDPFSGLVLNTSKLTLYQAVTHYPIGTGEMAAHIDPNSILPIHFNLPLSNIGSDYELGGLYVIKSERKINIDKKMNLGDLLLFNGGVPHGIDNITGSGSKTSIGRLQMFGVPFIMGSRKKSILHDISNEIYGRYKYANYSFGVGFRDDFKNFR